MRDDIALSLSLRWVKQRVHVALSAWKSEEKDLYNYSVTFMYWRLDSFHHIDYSHQRTQLTVQTQMDKARDSPVAVTVETKM